MESRIDHILVFPVSCQYGMAGTRRVRSLIDNLPNADTTKLSNLIVEEPGTHTLSYSYKSGPYYCLNVGYKYTNVLSWLKFWWNCMEFIYKQRVVKGSNVLYAYTDPDLFLLPIIIFSRAIGYLAIFDIVEDNSFASGCGRSKLGSFRRETGVYMSRYLRFYADGLVVISNHLMEKFHVLTPSLPILLAPVTVDFRYIQSNFTRSESPTIFYGGSFGEKDGITLLLQALKKITFIFPNCQLKLTGQGSSQDMAIFWKQVDLLHLRTQINYLGFISVESYWNAICSSDILCMVRTNNSFANAGFPFKLGEMLATGNLVIATAVSDIPYFLTDYENALLIEPDNLEALVGALHWSLTYHTKRIEIGKRGRDVAFREFNAEIVGSRLGQFLNSLI